MTPDVKLTPERVAKLRETVAEIADGPYKEMHGDTLTDARVIVMLADHYLRATQRESGGESVSVPREAAERLYKAAIRTADFTLLQLGGFDPPESAPMKYDDAVQLSHDAKALKAALSASQRKEDV